MSKDKYSGLAATLVIIAMTAGIIFAHALAREDILQGEIVQITRYFITIIPGGERESIRLPFAEDALILQNGREKGWQALNPVYPGAFQDGVLHLRGGKVFKVAAYYHTFPVRILKTGSSGWLVKVLPGDGERYREGKTIKLFIDQRQIKIFPAGSNYCRDQLPVMEGQAILVILGINDRLKGLAI